MKRIVLTGFRGTGKTEIGRIVAGRLGLPFLDTDQLIEQKSGRSIPEIFEKDGEAAFRAIEGGVIAALPPENAVVSTGGGVVTDPANVEQLRRESIVVLLTADPGILETRLAHAPRPPLTSLPLREEITEILKKRRRFYQASADFCIDSGPVSLDQAADEILGLVRYGRMPEQGRAEGFEFFKAGRIPAPALQRLEDILAGKNRDPRTRILGVAGYPCIHSRGPGLFNALFSRYHLNYHYTWFEHPDIGRIIKVARGLDVKGLSVTIPFKREVMQYLDIIEEDAQQIGAVNTVIFACGSATGCNTDWLGVQKPLVSLRGAQAVLLGAGGVASAAAYALLNLGMEVTVLNRTPENAQKLAEHFGCRYGRWEDFDRIRPDLVVNATPLGMHPDTQSPLAPGQLRKEMTVFDLVYTPPVTPLIAAARRAGCRTITGTGMFIEQAREQFLRYFGIDVPAETMQEILT